MTDWVEASHSVSSQSRDGLPWSPAKTFGDDLPRPHSACAIQICQAEMAEGRCKDRANEPAGTGSNKCPFGPRTPPRLGPSQLLQAWSKFGPCRRPRKPYSGLARRRCRKLCLGLPITVTIGHPKVGKSVLIGR